MILRIQVQESTNLALEIRDHVMLTVSDPIIVSHFDEIYEPFALSEPHLVHNLLFFLKNLLQIVVRIDPPQCRSNFVADPKLGSYEIVDDRLSDYVAGIFHLKHTSRFVEIYIMCSRADMQQLRNYRIGLFNDKPGRIQTRLFFDDLTR